MTEVSKLKANLENANHTIEVQHLREDERDRQIADHTQQMEEMKKMSRTQREVVNTWVHIFQYLICLILHMRYSNSAFMSFVGLTFVTRA